MADTQTKKSLLYVSTKDLPELPAPINTSGPVAWMRMNLFATVRDTILTVVFSVLVIAALYKLIPWLITDAVFFADSIRHCREIDTGACFAVVTSRFNQLVFGFYPPEHFWRPIVTFFLMLVAFAPLLHENLPRKLLWFTGLF